MTERILDAYGKPARVRVTSSTQAIVSDGKGHSMVLETPVGEKRRAPLTTTYAQRVAKKAEEDPAYAKRNANHLVGVRSRLVKDDALREQHDTYADKTRERIAATPPKVQPRPPIHFADEVSYMGLSGMPVEDDGEWSELLDSHYWSRLVVEHGATGYVGKRIHIMESGNWRGCIEITQIDKDPDGVPDKHRVAVKKIA
jgi:hypothetical protein